MASVNLVLNGDCSENPNIDKVLPPEYDDEFSKTEIFPQIPSNSLKSFDKLEEPEILTRIGHEYQAEVPPLIRRSNYFSDWKSSTDADNKACLLLDFFIGLPVPLTSKCITRQEMLGSCNRPKSMFDSRELDPFTKMETSFGGTEPSLDSTNLMTDSMKLSASHKGDEPSYGLVPGLPNEGWTKSERDSFLLGLYIFEKNFVEIKLFVETKEMGSILSFYYGEFYGTQEYERWSVSRKTKRKKCVYGQRIFSGQRQKELLSRILPVVSEECRNALLEVSKTFSEEKMSLSDYVLSLKSMVGNESLVKAVGIGTGKQDLTGMAIESSRSSKVVPVRPETIPSGNACSSLTTTEIIKFLSGGYRLSKARSNDLFWEAVWPRLLARGWNSEQPNDQSYITGSSHSLVFLVPGVKKFSRRKLVKGDHYFDSVSDVLSKVAKEPRLIEFEDEQNVNDADKIIEDGDHTSEANSEEDNSDRSKRKQSSYLQPRTPKRSNRDVMFTIVDTSLSGGKMRELRGFPFEVSHNSTAQLCVERRDEDEDDTDEDVLDESETIKKDIVDASEEQNVFLNTEKSAKNMFTSIKNHNANGYNRDVDTVYHGSMAPLVSDLKKTTKRKKNNLQENKQTRRKALKPLSSRKLKKEQADHPDPISKRCSTLTARSEEETKSGMVDSLTEATSENGMSNFCANTHEFTNLSSPEAGLYQDILSSTNECLEKNAKIQPLIDLNFPQVSLESEKTTVSSTIKLSTTSEKLSDSIPRRHSTRNRPPTARALEALADGYLTTNNKRKGMNTRSNEGSNFRTLKRTNRVVIGSDESPDSFSDSRMVGNEKDVSSNTDNGSMLSGSQVLSEANDESEQ